MAVMFVRIVWVHMAQRRMRVGMHVRLGACLPGMNMLMVRVVDVQMGVGQQRMRVFVLVALGEVQPQADHHQNPGGNQLNRHWLAEEDNRDQGAHERCEKK